MTSRGNVPEVYYIEPLPLRLPDLDVLPEVLTRLEQSLREWDREDFRNRIRSALEDYRGGVR